VPRDPLVFLDDILESCRKIEAYRAGLDFEAFQADEKTIDAIVRNLEIIGEATKKLPGNLRAVIPGVDWQRIAGLRDILIHTYFGIDLVIIWDVVVNRVPELRNAVAKFLSR
jgi:uncharacterized protein with HEPN domain